MKQFIYRALLDYSEEAYILLTEYNKNLHKLLLILVGDFKQ